MLVEGRRDPASNLCVGLSDNYIKTLLPGEEGMENELLPVFVERAREDLVFAEREE